MRTPFGPRTRDEDAEPTPPPTPMVSQAAYVQLATDFASYRHRTEQDLARARVEAYQDFATDLLPLLDFVEEATRHEVESALAAPLAALVVEMTTRRGLVAVGGVGDAFDPRVHEALEADEPVAGPSPLVVVEVLRRGYRHEDRLVRPALVRVGATLEG